MPRAIALLATLILSVAPVPASETGGGSRNSDNTLRLEPGEAAPPATIDQLAWLAGYWKGEGLGGISEEFWGPPVGGRMYGIYVLTRDGAVVFSESMMLVEVDGTVELRVKHFTPDFVGWEEKDGHITFPLVRLGDNEVYLSGLTFRRSGDSLEIYLVLSQDGKRTEHSFRLARTPLG